MMKGPAMVDGMTDDEAQRLNLDGAMGVILSLEDNYIISFLITSWISLIAHTTGEPVEIVDMADRLSPIAEAWIASYRASARAHGVANA